MSTDKGEKPNTAILFFSDPCPSVLSVVKFFRIHDLKNLRNYGKFCATMAEFSPFPTFQEDLRLAQLW